MESPETRDGADGAQNPNDVHANADTLERPSPLSQIPVSKLVLGATFFAVLVRGMTFTMSLKVVWPLFGTVVTFFPRSMLRVGAAAEILFSLLLVLSGMLTGLKARKHAVVAWKRILWLGWFLVVDVAVYLASIVVSIALLPAGVSLGGPMWVALAIYILLGNLVLLWLGLQIVRAGRALKPPPVEED